MKELFETRAKRLFFTASNCIPVDRENVTIDMYHNVADVLSSGKILAMFPEGKINFDEQAEVKKFKGGAALFAIMNKVPVVPVYIVKRTKWYQRQKMVVGEPIYLEEICDGTPSLMDVEKVSEYLHSKEDELVAFYEEKCSKKKKEKKDND
jgi:1-acyl-sn-glycerol-3-phosphate acyltransferase